MEAIALMFATEMAIAWCFVKRAIAQAGLLIRFQPSHQIIRTRKIQ
jgi:hypothetical protein